MNRSLSIFNQLRPFTVGYDNVFDRWDTMFNDDHFFNNTGNYPPYNIVKDGDDIRIELAVAGFTEKDVSVDVQGNTLTIKSISKNDESDTDFLFKGIANRSFDKQFQLAKTIVVDDAKLTNGILSVYMHDEIPENQKPRQIAINSPNKKGGKTQFLSD